MAFEPLLQQLINELRTLPGVGPKSAQRMAFYLLSRNRQGGKVLGESLIAAMHHIQFCQNCRHFTQNTLCSFCLSTQRQTQLLCIVENPADLIALEQTGYQGLYFVLHGRLSPLDGIGPAQLGLEALKQILQKNTIQEMILATNPTVEGEATAHYLAQMAKHYGIKCTRLAHGIPLGGELEYLDGGTLTHAFAGREVV